jgi:uncharacterized protein YegL
MPDSDVWLLAPGGLNACTPLPGNVALDKLGDAIALALGLPREGVVTLRRRDGTLIDQSASLIGAGVRPGDVVLVETTPAGKRRSRRGTNRRPVEVIAAAYRVLPCYLVVDTSASMQGSPIETVNTELPRLRLKMLREPELAEVCHLALVTFNTTAMVRMSLTDISEAAFTALQADGRTDYCPVFELLKTTIANDLYMLYRHGRQPYRPVVFFLSDGMHNGTRDWHDALEALTDRGAFYGAPNIIAFGFGDAQEQAIRDIGRKAAYMPKQGTSAGPAATLNAFMAFLLSSLTASMTQTNQDKDDVLVLPDDDDFGQDWLPLTVQQ